MKRWMAIAVGSGLLVSACTAGESSTSVETVDPSASNAPVTVELTGEWTSNRECTQWQESFKDGFESTYPWITVDAKCGITEEQQIAAINAGNPPDVFLSFGVDNVGRFCDSGAWADLNQYIDDPNVGDRPQRVPRRGAHVHELQRDPVLAAVPHGHDRALLQPGPVRSAGLSGPPATTDELTDYAKELTQFNADGSIAVAGFVPVTDYYCCSSNLVNLGHMFGATYLDEAGAPAYASDPAWAEMFQWQHDLIAEVYGDGDFQTGADKLRKFVAGAGNEWGAPQDFQKGRVAMQIDGEWRNAFLADFAPDLNYDTAPLPTSPSTTDRYGSASRAVRSSACRGALRTPPKRGCC